MRWRRPGSPIPVLVVLAALALPAGIAAVSVGSGATFADDERFTGNRLGAGSVEVAIDEVDVSDEDGRPVTTGDPAVFSAANLAPGDRVTGALAVNNNGTLPLRFWITAKAATSSDALGDWLLFAGWVAPDCRTGPDAADRLYTDQPGHRTPPRSPLIGDATALDGELRLDPGQELVVCVGAHLPLAAPNDVQAATLDVELIVAAQHALEEG